MERPGPGPGGMDGPMTAEDELHQKAYVQSVAYDGLVKLGFIAKAAQAWHDTDHAHVGGCYCCCKVCDPAGNENGRPNPYWSRTRAEAEQLRSMAGMYPVMDGQHRVTAMVTAMRRTLDEEG